MLSMKGRRIWDNIYTNNNSSVNFKHILLFYTKQLDRTQVSQLLQYIMNKYKVNLYNIVYIFHKVKAWRRKKHTTKTKNVECHANGSSKLKYT